ncbi:DNA-binding transcriptional LysR family regulator [Bradyrhizobium sp. LM4.3]
MSYRGASAKNCPFGNSSLAYQAAIDGLGVAMAHLELIQDDLDGGRLLALHPLVVRSADSYRLVGRESEIGRPEIAAFRNWVLSEAEIT